MLTPFMQRLRESIMPLHDEAEKVGPLHAIPDKTIRHEDYIKDLGTAVWFRLCCGKM